MRVTPFAWPAFGGRASLEPLRFDRGVWGKVHGASSDFRWITRSAGFFPKDRTVPRALSTGSEDRPRRSAYWRALPQAYAAVSSYPSRSTDAAGRGGHLLEKQILLWSRGEDLPAALGALLLLPHGANLQDDVWWSARRDSRWQGREFSLTLPPSDHEPLEVSEELLSRAISRGRKRLKEAVSLEALTELYGRLGEAPSPGWLRGLEKPLPPEALAVLLLPLPRASADRLSLAGWIPSSRVDLDQMSKRWDILVEPVDRSFARHSFTSEEALDRGRKLAEGLWNGDPGLIGGSWRSPFGNSLGTPPGEPDDVSQDVSVPVQRPEDQETQSDNEIEVLGGDPEEWNSPDFDLPEPPGVGPRESQALKPGLRLALTPPPQGSPRFLVELHEFADCMDRRWISRKNFTSWGSMHCLNPVETAAKLLLHWVQQVRKHRPVQADSQQWAAKVELLEAAVVTLVPTGQKDLGTFRRQWVPPLYFGPCLKKPDELSRMGLETLRANLEGRVAVPNRVANELQSWLRDWESSSRDRRIRSLLQEVLSVQQ